MKKTTRVLVALLALTLVTSCFVGGTFAKYVTADTASDNARVAKWGVTVDAVADGAFATEYAAEAVVQDINGEDIVNTVVSSNTDKLVAPGTGADFGSITISGTPEVAVAVTKTADLALTGDWTAGGAYYCPLKITVGSTTFNGLDYASISEFEAAVEASINDADNYQANEDIGYTIDASWAWDFEGADNGNAADGQNDVKDTELGNKAMNGDIEIALTIGATVTQID